MTTEQMDWLDDHDPGRFRRDPKRKPLLEWWRRFWRVEGL